MRLYEIIGPEGQCFEKLKLQRHRKLVRMHIRVCLKSHNCMVAQQKWHEHAVLELNLLFGGFSTRGATPFSVLIAVLRSWQLGRGKQCFLYDFVQLLLLNFDIILCLLLLVSVTLCVSRKTSLYKQNKYLACHDIAPWELTFALEFVSG